VHAPITRARLDTPSLEGRGPGGGSTEAPPAPSPSAQLPTLTLAQLGLEGPNQYAGGAAEAVPGGSEGSAPEDRVRQSIADGVLAHDRSVGLGAEGPAITAIEEAVYASAASANGVAVLAVTADGAGVVTGVWCTSGARAEWDAVAAEVARALTGKRLRKAPGGRGVEMRVEVTTREEMPSGRDPGVEVRVLHLPIKRGRGPRSTRVDVLDLAPKIVVDPAPDTAAATRAFPPAHIEVGTILGIDGDLVDIGAKPRRVVHAKVLDEHAL
jgi:hypothetical protein